MNDIGIAYVVGGDNKHYDALDTSIRSVLQRMTNVSEIHITEFGNKLQSKDNIKVTNIPTDKVMGHILWQYKYHSILQLTTKYVLYLDTDTVVPQDTSEYLIRNCPDGIGVTPHFWIKDIQDFILKHQPINYELVTDILCNFNIANTIFCAGGVIWLRNNHKNRNTIKVIFDYLSKVYPEITSPYIPGLTDEVILSHILGNCNDNTVYMGGGFNHCAMVDMPLNYVGICDTLFGCNPHEKRWTPVTALHCDITRRDPSSPYSGPLKEFIKNAFYL